MSSLIISQIKKISDFRFVISQHLSLKHQTILNERLEKTTINREVMGLNEHYSFGAAVVGFSNNEKIVKSKKYSHGRS